MPESFSRHVRVLAAAVLLGGVLPMLGSAQAGTRVEQPQRNRPSIGGQHTSERVDLADLALLSALRGLSDLQSLGGLGGLPGLSDMRAQGGLSGLKALSATAGLSGLSALSQLSALSAADGLGALAALDGPTDIVFRNDPLSGDEQVADSLYRKAREALGNGDYRRAASLFQQIASKYPKTRYAGDALYFRAFSLYRAGDTRDLRAALGDLQTLATTYPSSSTQGDGRTLRFRICGELAQRGDEACAAEVEASARTSASSRAAASGAAAAASGQQGTRCPSEDDDDDERIAALNALLQMDSERALPILERVLARRDACSVGLRRKAVFLVSQKGNARAADILLNAAKTDPDKEVRGQALFWLGQTRDERAVDMLDEVLKNSNDRELLDKAIFGLSQHRSERAQQILRNTALNESLPTETREQAIFWLGQRSAGENAAFLRQLYDRLKSEELKEKVLFSASQQRSTENASWLLGIAQNERESTELRKKALFWAGQSKMISLAELGNMYDRLSDREMKEQVIFVLSQRRDTEAVDKLLDIARNEKDRDLRKKAVFWLSQSKDPRIAKFLEDLISK